MTQQKSGRGFLYAAGIAALTVLCSVLGQNVALAKWPAAVSRFTVYFSSAFLEHRLSDLDNADSTTLAFGDSVLWGYHLHAGENAIANLARSGKKIENFSFKAGTPANYYALLLLMKARHVHPRSILLEINQKVLNPANDAYNTLHPALEAAAWNLLTPEDQAQLRRKHPPDQWTRYDRLLSSIWLVYGMRADLRETLNPDPESAIPPNDPELYLGSYDLSPLDRKNVGVYFLQRFFNVAHTEHIPVVAFFTPENHVLLHDYIDSPEYQTRKTFLHQLCVQANTPVLDLDSAFAPSEFIDDIHLTAAADKRLATLLAPLVK